jgi:hypothetical protein
MRISAACTALVALFLGTSQALGQDRNESDRLVEAFFENRNYAPPSQAVKSCPGDDALSDAVMASLTRPRPAEETRRLINAWGYVPECRVREILDWCQQASRIIDNELYAASLARKVMSVDSVQGLPLLRSAAADPLVPDEARGAYQVAVYYRLSTAELEQLFIETFRGELQAGMYLNMALGGLVTGPGAEEVAPRLVAEMLEHPLNEGAPRFLGVILNVVTTSERERFSDAERERIWALIEPYLDSLPPDMREGVESYEADLKAGPA